jgi:hypothetical protein
MIQPIWIPEKCRLTLAGKSLEYNIPIVIRGERSYFFFGFTTGTKSKLLARLSMHGNQSKTTPSRADTSTISTEPDVVRPVLLVRDYSNTE